MDRSSFLHLVRHGLESLHVRCQLDLLLHNVPSPNGVALSPDGRVVSENEWNARKNEWLPSDEDRAFVASLMGRVVEPGQFANWIAPPVMGINRQPVNYEYVRFG